MEPSEVPLLDMIFRSSVKLTLNNRMMSPYFSK